MVHRLCRLFLYVAAYSQIPDHVDYCFPVTTLPLLQHSYSLSSGSRLKNHAHHARKRI